MANSDTRKAKLTYNVLTVRNKMKEQFDTQGYEYTFQKGYTGVAAILQEATKLYMEEVVKHTQKDKTGLRQVKVQQIQYALMFNAGTKDYYARRMEYFDEKQTYCDQLPVDKRQIDSVVKSVDQELSLSPPAFNFLCYALLSVFLDVVNSACLMVEFAKKKTIDRRSIEFAVRQTFGQSVANRLNAAVATAFQHLKDEGDDGTESEEEAGEDKKEKKPKKEAKDKEAKEKKPKKEKDDKKEKKPKKVDDDGDVSDQDVATDDEAEEVDAKAKGKDKGNQKAKAAKN